MKKICVYGGLFLFIRKFLKIDVQHRAKQSSGVVHRLQDPCEPLTQRAAQEGKDEGFRRRTTLVRERGVERFLEEIMVELGSNRAMNLTVLQPQRSPDVDFQVKRN